jgi:hypothetical protein
MFARGLTLRSSFNNPTVIVIIVIILDLGRAAAQAVSRLLPTSAARSGHVDKAALSTAVAPAKHSTHCSTLIIIDQ